MSNFSGGRAAGFVEPLLALAAPINLVATPATDSVVLDWTAVSGTGITYEVYVALASASFSSTPTTTGLTSPTQTVTGLTEGVLYQFKVVARSATLGVSGPSNIAYGRPTDFNVTWNPLDVYAPQAPVTFSNGNKTADVTGTGQTFVRATAPSKNSGKKYFEITVNTIGNGNIIGFGSLSAGIQSFAGGFGITAYGSGVGTTAYAVTAGGGIGTAGPRINTTGAGKTICFAIDFDAKKTWIGVNGVFYGVGDPAAANGDPANGLNPTLTNVPLTLDGVAIVELFVSGPPAGNVTGRFKTADFIYAPPSGFSAWDM